MNAAGRRAGRWVLLALLPGLLSGIGSPARAREADPPRPSLTRFEGVVTRVVDGDTVWVRPRSPERRPLKLRLVGIDAPERCQRWGEEARRALTRRVLDQPVAVETAARDDYGRALGRLLHQGEDLNAWLVASGHAWSARSRHPRARYAALQRAARDQRRGLFADPAAQPPWEFRRQHGPCP